MRILAASMLALGLSLGAHAQDTSRDGELVTSVNTVDMRYLIESAGFTVTQAMSTGIGLVGQDSAGLVFGVAGKACGDSPDCLGLDLFFYLEGEFTPKDANSLNQRWSAIKATVVEDGRMTLSRYLILDHGQTLENIRLNLLTTHAIVQSFLAENEEPEEEDGPLASDLIDWGDDSGSYANDDACDDARFHEDGDDWGYQRNHVRRDATDCQSAYESGTLTLFLDFGDDSGENADNQVCDDNRFSGEGMSDAPTDADVKKDASDCISAYQVDLLSRP